MERVLYHPADKEKNNFEAYYLRPKEGGRMMSTLITFTPEGIVIMGDLCPDENGVISCYGYGRAWFTGKLSSRYLCEKFLHQKWEPKAAIEWVKDHIESIKAGDHDDDPDYDNPPSPEVKKKREEMIEKFTPLIGWLDSDMDARQFYDALEEAGYVVDDGLPGWDYSWTEAGLLAALQQKFAELWNAPAEKKEEVKA